MEGWYAIYELRNELISRKTEDIKYQLILKARDEKFYANLNQLKFDIKTSTRESSKAFSLRYWYAYILSLYQFFYTFIFRSTHKRWHDVVLHPNPPPTCFENILCMRARMKKTLMLFIRFLVSVTHPPYLRKHLIYSDNTAEWVESFLFLYFLCLPHPNVTFLNCVSLTHISHHTHTDIMWLTHLNEAKKK